MRIPTFLSGLALGACLATAASTLAKPAIHQNPPSESADRVAIPQGLAPTVMSLKEAERRVAPSGKASIAILARGDNAFLGQLEMVAGGSVPEHRDATEEYIYILEGGGEMMIDDVAYPVGPGSAIFMPANAKVSFKGGAVPLKALQVFAGPEPSAKYDSWTRP